MICYDLGAKGRTFEVRKYLDPYGRYKYIYTILYYSIYSIYSLHTINMMPKSEWSLFQSIFSQGSNIFFWGDNYT